MSMPEKIAWKMKLKLNSGYSVLGLRGLGLYFSRVLILNA